MKSSGTGKFGRDLITLKLKQMFSKNCYLADGITILLSLCIHNNHFLALNTSNHSGFR